MNFGFDSKHRPDRFWLLSILSTMNPNHKYFETNYQPLPEEIKTKKDTSE